MAEEASKEQIFETVVMIYETSMQAEINKIESIAVRALANAGLDGAIRELREAWEKTDGNSESDEG